MCLPWRNSRVSGASALSPGAEEEDSRARRRRPLSIFGRIM
jgi:hypothetical protein